MQKVAESFVRTEARIKYLRAQKKRELAELNKNPEVAELPAKQEALRDYMHAHGLQAIKLEDGSSIRLQYRKEMPKGLQAQNVVMVMRDEAEHNADADAVAKTLENRYKAEVRARKREQKLAEAEKFEKELMLGGLAEAVGQKRKVKAKAKRKADPVGEGAIDPSITRMATLRAATHDELYNYPSAGGFVLTARPSSIRNIAERCNLPQKEKARVLCLGSGNGYEAMLFAAWGEGIKAVGIEMAEDGHRAAKWMRHNYRMEGRVQLYCADASERWSRIIPKFLTPRTMAEEGRVHLIYSCAIVDPWLYRRFLMNARHILRAQKGSLWISMFRSPMWTALGLTSCNPSLHALRSFEAEHGLRVLEAKTSPWTFSGSGKAQAHMCVKVELVPRFKEPELQPAPWEGKVAKLTKKQELREMRMKARRTASAKEDEAMGYKPEGKRVAVY